MGRPAALQCSGRLIAGCPVALKAPVNGQKAAMACWNCAIDMVWVESSPILTGGVARAGVTSTSGFFEEAAYTPDLAVDGGELRGVLHAADLAAKSDGFMCDVFQFASLNGPAQLRLARRDDGGQTGGQQRATGCA